MAGGGLKRGFLGALVILGCCVCWAEGILWMVPRDGMDGFSDLVIISLFDLLYSLASSSLSVAEVFFFHREILTSITLPIGTMSTG